MDCWSTFAASIVKSVYGVEVAEKNDKNVALMISVLEGIQAFTPGRFLVQYMPFLEHVPYWFPIAGRQLRELKVWQSASREVKNTLFNQTKDKMVSVARLTEDLGD